MGSVVLDSSVVIGFLQPDDVHHARARSIMIEHRLDEKIIPATVYSEILVRAHRAGRADDIDEFIADIAAEIVPVDRALARHAAELRAEHRSLRLPDAIVLATARRLGAQLITFDNRLAGFA